MKNILIVGSTKGIGLATAQILKHENKLYTVSRNSSEESQRENHFVLDVTKDNLDALNNLPNELHGIVYCPGSINLKGFNRLTIEDFLNDFNQNVVGAIKTIQFCLPRLKNAKNASIVMYSTVAVGTGMNFHSSVATSKAAVEGLAKSLAAEFAGSNIRVNVIAPSLTNTPLAAALLNTPEKIEASNKRHPLQRIGTAEDIAEMTAFLLSDKATWITGQVMHVDGGMGTLK
jgi:NAD(P)-dependent dehydrogenase (short-subunit alcohol dehydrogenase family)